MKAHRAKIRALLDQPAGRGFFEDITSAKMRLISRHLNLLNRKMLTEGPSHIPEEIFDRVAQVPDLMAS